MKKYKVTQEFMDVLKNWNDEYKDTNGVTTISDASLDDWPDIVIDWSYKNLPKKEYNKRFGAIINWINGEDVFEIGTPKYIVQRKGANLKHLREYIRITEYDGIEIDYFKENATRFDNFDEASEWANKHFEVVELDE